MRKASAIEAFVVWALRIVLAAILLLAGLPKLLGMGTMGLQAAAMRGFPTWIRVVVGAVEVLGAIGLLIPGTATVAAVSLALLMFPASVAQHLSGEPGVWVPIAAMVTLLLVAWRMNAKTVSDGYHGFANGPHPLLRDGVIAGLIGASVIAVWFFIIDSIAGRPLYTPALLGHGLFSVLGHPSPSDGPFAYVVAYTVFHFAAFMLVGLVASLILFLAHREPSILFAFILLFAATEVGIYGLVALLEVATPLGRHAWLQMMVGNLLAAAAMGFYFWRGHRELGDEFRHSLDYEEPTAGDQLRWANPPRAVAGAPGGGEGDGSIGSGRAT